ncbi:probable RNA methyltransferase CG11342 [Euwallacea fornicatus]|uniref:probable RNA methyltransferase CG11342 n=1 Tax=Euwallacea fornicatus TaxID=995702 RepID=UPI00338F905C
MTELNFKCGNPGAVQFGNFINYYQFHPPNKRIAMLPTNIWDIVGQGTKYCALDVGCNAGDLTIALYDFLNQNESSKKCNILGIDIDSTLIQRANEKNHSDNIVFKCIDIMADQAPNDIIKEFLKSKKKTVFNIVFCFSITMWIHLNHGDEGLRRFLKKITYISNFLIIEPQPWKCYKTAVKRFKLGKSEFPKFQELKIRQKVEEEIENFIVEECDFDKVEESCRTEWGRKLLFFRRKNM